MPRVVTINRPDVTDMIERVAALETGGNKTEAVALLLIASAIDLGCPLLTYDTKITHFARDHGLTHRFTALS